jgi:hypothetical protein
MKIMKDSVQYPLEGYMKNRIKYFALFPLHDLHGSLNILVAAPPLCVLGGEKNAFLLVPEITLIFKNIV